MTDTTPSKECLHGQLIRGDTGPWYCASPDCGFTIWPQTTAPETPVQSPLWAFVERVATYSDYTHDDVDELKILKDIQAAAAFLYGDGSGTQRTLQQTGWWQCPCCQNYYTPERLVCPVSGDYRPLKANAHVHMWCHTSGEDHWYCTQEGCQATKPWQPYGGTKANPCSCGHDGPVGPGHQGNCPQYRERAEKAGVTQVDPARWALPPEPSTWMPAWLREFHCQCETKGDAAGQCVACQAAELIERAPLNGGDAS